MITWTISSVTRCGCFNCQTFFHKSAPQELIVVSPDPKKKTLLNRRIDFEKVSFETRCDFRKDDFEKLEPEKCDFKWRP